MTQAEHVVITVGETELWLLAYKAIYCPAYQALFIADPHFGKADHFRKSGIPVPNGADATNYAWLERLLEAYPGEAVYFLGDLFHSDHNQAWNSFTAWLRRYADTQFYLVQGNHDILVQQAYQEAGLWLYAPPVDLGPLTLSHEPLETVVDGQLNLCGHWHPAVKLRGGGRQSLKLPCFYHKAQQLVLPAFGQFTGNAVVQPAEGEAVYPVGEGQVFAF
jgi:DNA ligase-associated metallophosphoesterase